MDVYENEDMQSTQLKDTSASWHCHLAGTVTQAGKLIISTDEP